MDKLSHAAIQAALKQNWKDAVLLNAQILALQAENIDAIIRLAHAYFALGDIAKAKKHAQLALKIFPNHTIATRCLEKCKALKGSDRVRHSPSQATLRSFVENPSATKIVKLVHLGKPQILSVLQSGELLTLSVSAHKVCVETEHGEHVGRLPDDVAFKVTQDEKDKGYIAIVKFATPSEVTIILQDESPKRS